MILSEALMCNGICHEDEDLRTHEKKKKFSFHLVFYYPIFISFVCFRGARQTFLVEKMRQITIGGGKFKGSVENSVLKW